MYWPILKYWRYQIQSLVFSFCYRLVRVSRFPHKDRVDRSSAGFDGGAVPRCRASTSILTDRGWVCPIQFGKSGINIKPVGVRFSQWWTPMFGPPNAEIESGPLALRDEFCLLSLFCVFTITPLRGTGVQPEVPLWSWWLSQLRCGWRRCRTHCSGDCTRKCE